MKILIAKKIDFEKINIICNTYEFSFDQEVQNTIDALRNKKVIEAKEKWQNLWDWLNYYLMNYTLSSDSLKFDFWTVRFRNISMTNFLPDSLKEKIKNNQPKWIFVAWIVKTQDDYFLFPRRSGNDVTKTISWEITTFWWVLQPDEKHIEHFIDIRHHMMEELHEELWIAKNNITHGEFIWLTLSKALNRGIIFNINININHIEALNYFKKNGDWEMSEVLCIPKHQVLDFLNTEWFDESWLYKSNLWLYRELLTQTKVL